MAVVSCVSQNLKTKDFMPKRQVFRICDDAEVVNACKMHYTAEDRTNNRDGICLTVGTTSKEHRFGDCAALASQRPEVVRKYSTRRGVRLASRQRPYRYR